MTPSPHSATDARAHAAETRVLRYISKSMRLPALCRSAACHRRRTCKGDPRNCLARFAPLVPEDAREWMKISLDGQKEGRDFDDLRADYPDEFEAFAAWYEAVERAYG